MSIDISKVARTSTGPAVPARPARVGRAASWADERLGLAKLPKLMSLRKVFPDHWSFMLGEVALWSFVVLLITGTFLTLWYDPSMAEVQYDGSYDPLRGVHMSSAYASSLEISFDVRGGLLMRQMHHWAAHIFIAAMLIHLLRHAVTGSFRKPREVNWIIGCTLLLLGTLEGFLGYSLPDDLLSGTGLRAFDGFLKSAPVVGTYLSFFIFGGEFPGDQVIPRFYALHILLIPGLILALVAVHLVLIVYHSTPSGPVRAAPSATSWATRCGRSTPSRPVGSSWSCSA
jgi:ubiquinol-cytochrome c reductase cytochrome b subunit